MLKQTEDAKKWANYRANRPQLQEDRIQTLPVITEQVYEDDWDEFEGDR